MKFVLLVLFALGSLWGESHEYQSIFDKDFVRGYYVGVDSTYQDYNGDGVLLYGAKVGLSLLTNAGVELDYRTSGDSMMLDANATKINKYRISSLFMGPDYEVIHGVGRISAGIQQLSSDTINDDNLFFGLGGSIILNIVTNVKIAFNLDLEISSGVDYGPITDGDIGIWTGGVSLIYGIY